MSDDIFNSNFIKEMIIRPFLICLFCFGLFSTILSQTTKIQNVNDLIQKVLDKFQKDKEKLFNEYQSSYKSTVELQNENKKLTWTYELYCVSWGASNCRLVLIEKNGIPLSTSKIQKSREKIAKELSKLDKKPASVPSSYGLSVGYPGEGKNIWIDSHFYLKNCQVNSSSEQLSGNRKVVIVRFAKCNVENEKWKNYLQFMTKTEAEILIDESDESVMQMNVYPQKDFLSNTEQNKPIITVENIRMPEGYWLFKKVRLETTNKNVFPTMKDNFQFDFFDYKRLSVEVESKEIKQN